MASVVAPPMAAHSRANVASSVTRRKLTSRGTLLAPMLPFENWASS